MSAGNGIEKSLDFYVREYITNASPSAISWVLLPFILNKSCNLCISSCSWIGSVNAFLLISGGVVAGRFYDRGYLWASLTNLVLDIGYLRGASYTLLYGGSLLTVFSLFMLSLTKPDNYYQVLIFTLWLDSSNAPFRFSSAKELVLASVAVLLMFQVLPSFLITSQNDELWRWH